MRIGRQTGFLLCAAALTLAGAAGDALAHGGGERPLSTLPPAPPGDGAKAEQILREIEARVAKGAKGDAGKPAAKSPAAKVVAEPMEHAKKALARAHGAREAGDAAHARLLDGLALEWAENARDLLRAADAEAAAVETAQKARDVSTQLERARALLEETQARRGRAAAELERVEAAAREAAAAAASAEQGRIEAAKKEPQAAPKKAPATPTPSPKPPAKQGSK